MAAKMLNGIEVPMKLVLVVNQKARPPRKVHVFHVLAGMVVSTRAVCGRVRPEGEVQIALPATKQEVNRYNFHLEGDTICEQCLHSFGSDGWFVDLKLPFLRDPDDIQQLKW